MASSKTETRVFVFGSLPELYSRVIPDPADTALRRANTTARPATPATRRKAWTCDWRSSAPRFRSGQDHRRAAGERSPCPTVATRRRGEPPRNTACPLAPARPTPGSCIWPAIATVRSYRTAWGERPAAMDSDQRADRRTRWLRESADTGFRDLRRVRTVRHPTAPRSRRSFTRSDIE